MRLLGVVLAAEVLNGTFGWPFGHVYVASLPKDSGRRQRMKGVMAGLSIKDYEVFDAVDGLDSHVVSEKLLGAMHKTSPENKCGDVLGSDFLEDHGRGPRAWTTGEQRGTVGCYLTHLHILENADRKRYPSVLILEDDLDPAADVMRGPLELQHLPDNWDMAYLGWSRHMRGVGRKHQQGGLDAPALAWGDCQTIKADHSLCRLKKPVLQQTHAIAISQKAYRPLIQFLNGALATKTACAIDQMYKAFFASHEFHVYAMTTPIFRQLTAERKAHSHIVAELEEDAQPARLRASARPRRTAEP